jgi:hypothetical protein
VQSLERARELNDELVYENVIVDYISGERSQAEREATVRE